MRDITALLVEDSAVHQRLLAEAFKAAGQPVHLLAHGDAESAWATLERMRYLNPNEWPDFAIIDIGLPGMSGIDLADRIRQQRHFDAWPVVILTASHDPDDRTEALMAKATGYFTKPTSPGGYTALARDILAFLGRSPRHGSKVPAHPKPPGGGKPDSR